MPAPAPTPTNIKLRKQSCLLEVEFDDGNAFSLPFELLRVYSPSAEVRGHGPGQEVLQVGKENVNISAIEPVGNYAVKIKFDDLHDSGIFSWKYLYELGERREELWTTYLAELEKRGLKRDPR